MSEEQPLEGELIEKGIPQTEAQLIIDARDTAISAERLLTNAGTEVIVASLTEVKGLFKGLEKKRKEVKEPILKQAKTIDAVFNIGLDPLKRAETHLKRLFSLLQQEEEDRRKKEAEAEAARIRKNAEKRAERQEAKGDDDAAQRAEDIRQQADLEAEAAQAAIATQAVEKPKGVGGRKVWKWEVTDMDALMRAYLAGDKRLRADMFQPNKAAINKMVKALEDGAADIDGLNVYSDTSVTVRT